MTYTPELSSGISESFFNGMETFAVQNNLSLQIKKRLTDLSIELFQNVQKHSAEPGSIHLEIKKIDKSYRIKSVNFIHKKDEKVLSQQIELINTLSLDELKKLHTVTLRKTVLSKKGGAGLGLYRIAIRSAQKLNYKFHSINNSFSSFTLQINLTA